MYPRFMFRGSVKDNRKVSTAEQEADARALGFVFHEELNAPKPAVAVPAVSTVAASAEPKAAKPETTVRVQKPPAEPKVAKPQE